MILLQDPVRSPVYSLRCHDGVVAKQPNHRASAAGTCLRVACAARSEAEVRAAVEASLEAARNSQDRQRGHTFSWRVDIVLKG